MRWIKLNTSITQWEWFQDANTLKLWIFLLANANYQESKYKGLTIGRGQYLTSVRQLSHHLQIAEMTVQRILKTLRDNGSIQIQKSKNLGTIISIVNYSNYQGDTYSEQQSVSTPVSTPVSTVTSTAVSTAASTQSKIEIEEKEIYKEKEIITVVPPNGGHPQTPPPHARHDFQKPTIADIQQYVDEKGYTDIDAEAFWNFYESKNWMIGKNKMTKWKAAVATWHRKNISELNNNTKHFNDNGTNQIDNQTRRLQNSLLSTYYTLVGGERAEGDQNISDVPDILFG